MLWEVRERTLHVDHRISAFDFESFLLESSLLFFPSSVSLCFFPSPLLFFLSNSLFFDLKKSIQTRCFERQKKEIREEKTKRKVERKEKKRKEKKKEREGSN